MKVMKHIPFVFGWKLILWRIFSFHRNSDLLCMICNECDNLPGIYIYIYVNINIMVLNCVKYAV